MNRFKTLALIFISFYMVANSSVSLAETGNPFTQKPEGEFTISDQGKLKKEININIDSKISSLEERLSREINNIKVTSNRSDTTNRESSIFGGEADKEEDSHIKKAVFVGCVDDKVLLKDKKTNDNFFVSIEEAKENEEFNKIGSCSF